MNCSLPVVPSFVRNFGWNLTVCLATLVLELWVALVVSLVGADDNLQINLILVNCLNLFAILCMFYQAIMIFYHKSPLAEDDTSRYMSLGDDYWPPFPCPWEWNSDPLLWNVCDYSKETGWAQLYPSSKGKDEGDLLEIDGHDDATLPEKELQVKQQACYFSLENGGNSDDSSLNQVVFLEPGNIQTASLTEHEVQYLASAKASELPTTVVCICYLLSKGSNRFLMESLEFFAKVHKAPIYVMANARQEGDWVEEELLAVSKFLQRRGLRQVRIFVVKSSRSKAANLNAFIDVLPKDDNHDEEYFKYVLNYDVDDRPTYNEASLLAYAENVVDTTRGGHKVVGVQGPCLEYYNDTFSGLLESWIEFNAQAGCSLVLWDSRFLGRVKSQGSNHLVLTSVFRRYRFDTSILLEDWRWSNDMLEKENLSLAYARTMVCLGQTPVGWKAIARRRNRWNKGRLQESLHDIFGRSITRSFLMEWIISWRGLLDMFFLRPLMHMLIIIGFDLIFQASGSHGRYGTLDPDQLEQDNGTAGILGLLWNFSWIASLAIVIGVHVGHSVRAMMNPQSSSFLNGRKTFGYKILHALIHTADMFMFLYAPLTRSYQYEYYCRVEYLLEKVFFQKTEWVATPKKAGEEIGSTVDFDLDSTSDDTSAHSKADEGQN